LLAIVAACGAVALWAGTKPANPDAVTQAPLGLAGKVLLVILAVWTGLHFFFAASEVFNQPLYPWDAWLAWVYRAKAWYLAGGMVDVVSPAQWATATSADVYTIHAWTYPRFPSVVPYWAALSLGRWSETLVNLPALLAGSAIGLALYGQCRESGMNPLLGITACYLLFSVPLFGTHIALAGYADIWMAGFAGLGFIALLRGALCGQHFQTLLGFLMIALAIGVKNEGAVWFLAALLMQALITFRWRTLAIAGFVLATAVWIGHAAFGISRSSIHSRFPGDPTFHFRVYRPGCLGGHLYCDQPVALAFCPRPDFHGLYHNSRKDETHGHGCPPGAPACLSALSACRISSGPR
jgi:hypothetical protein